MIDWGRVKELRLEIGADDFAEVVDMFLEEADEVITRLSVANGAKVLEADLHFLKGAALNLGFEMLAAQCQEGERRAASGDTGVDVAQVCQCYAASRHAFTTGLEDAVAA